MTAFDVGSGAANGLLPQPGAEVGTEHADEVGEESIVSLGNPIRSTVPGSSSGAGHRPRLTKAERKRIVRTTAKFRILFPDDDDERKQLLNRLYDSQRAASHAANMMMRYLWLKDGTALDAFRLEHGRFPKGSEWKCEFPKKPSLYNLGCELEPGLATSAMSTIARDVSKKWFQVRFEALVRMKIRPPHYKDSYPIPLRKTEIGLTAHPDGAMMRCLILSGRGNALSLKLKAHDAYHKRILKHLLDGSWELGNGRIVRDQCKGRDRWFLQLVYKRFVEESAEPKAAAINRGIRVFLAAVTEDGETALYDGDDIVATLKQFQKRRRQYQYNAKMSSRAGRGRKRILRPIESLRAKGERWRNTKCQTIARRLAQWLHDSRVGVLYMEDLSGIRHGEHDFGEHVDQLIQEWPYYKLQMMIVSACEEVGVRVVNVSPEYISQTCPSCGHVDEKNRDLRYWKLRCTNCSYSRHLDVAAAMNVLSRGRERSAADGDDGSGSQGKKGVKKGHQRTSRRTSGKRTRSKRSGKGDGKG